ncbi:CNP1-like family protein [Pseudogulbenkiania ferrooxidans]|uniref:CNP1-like uncharacterized domain-containing protein n=1 Tax=Pseudogulbenkiania ferrooxidans 2002 TaxID=279714 RepID=B9Z5Q9_9NEIS|nr:CNP1-like family protein [Pseudogulbenkiania ferrooxidans]EEG07906.1 Protein of unknown function CNP1-like protein [Pseudogulbenkiania ferrooxidans 2002]
MKRLITLLALSAGTLAAGASAGEIKRPNTNYALDDLPAWEEGAYALPAYPVDADWVGFFVHHTLQNQYFIDAKSVNVADEQLVRYVVKVVSPSGAVNLSAEGLQCRQKQIRSYAFGDTVNRRWIESMKPAWRNIEYDDLLHRRLRENLCQDNWAPKTAEEAVVLMRKAPWR